MGIPFYLVLIIQSFLRGRTFRVKVEDSVLSPTLFSCYINDIPMRYEKSKRYCFLFVDDLIYFALYKKSTLLVERQIYKYLGQFLGIRFEPAMCDKNQVRHIVSKCNQRLNIIKILSHKNWQLKRETLVNIYRSLVLSMIEYYSYAYYTLSQTEPTK